MEFNTSMAVTVAAHSAETPEVAATIVILSTGSIVEGRIGPILDNLIRRWIAVGSPPKTENPTLHPILILESVRVAEAINRLSPSRPHIQPVLDLLPLLTQATLEAGTMKIDNDGLLKLVRAAGLLKADPNQTQGSKESKELLTELALDCAGPLGAVYGVTVP
jgi:hypothetical protein